MATQRQLIFFRDLYQKQFKKSFGPKDNALNLLIDEFPKGTEAEEILEEMNIVDRD